MQDELAGRLGSELPSEEKRALFDKVRSHVAGVFQGIVANQMAVAFCPNLPALVN
jgi:hypothetical protein